MAKGRWTPFAGWECRRRGRHELTESLERSCQRVSGVGSDVLYRPSSGGRIKCVSRCKKGFEGLSSSVFSAPDSGSTVISAAKVALDSRVLRNSRKEAGMRPSSPVQYGLHQTLWRALYALQVSYTPYIRSITYLYRLQREWNSRSCPVIALTCSPPRPLPLVASRIINS